MDRVGKLKPNLVVKIQEGVLVVDVTVQNEDGEYLSWANTENIHKYWLAATIKREIWSL